MLKPFKYVLFNSSGTNNARDYQVLGDLLAQILENDRIDFVYTNGAYDMKPWQQVIADRQIHAVIPLRKIFSSDDSVKKDYL